MRSTSLRQIPLFFLLLVFGVAAAESEEGFPSLPLGDPGLRQEVESREIVEGVKFYSIFRGKRSKLDFFTLSAGADTREEQMKLARKMELLGEPFRLERPPEFAPSGFEFGIVLRSGKFESREAAAEKQRALSEKGIKMKVRDTAEDGNPTSGPFRVGVLEIHPDVFKGKIVAGLARDRIPEKETTSSLAERHKAVAAVNGGFFVFKEGLGTVGDLAGISIIDGKLASEGLEGRAALILENKPALKAWVAHDVRTKISVKVDGAEHLADGINRIPGKIFSCGNPGDKPVQTTAHDHVCEDENELVVFTPLFGEKAPKGKGFEVAVGADGRVLRSGRKMGGAVPGKGFLLQGTGRMGEWLESRTEASSKIEVSFSIAAEEGDIPLVPGLFAVNGGPTLVRKGEIDLDARIAEGFGPSLDRFEKNRDRLRFHNFWVLRRNPRTAVGISSEGTIFFVVVYGRRPGESAGASITEMARTMKALGAVEAFNLDGGGSSAMVVDGGLTGVPSDRTGERANGDAVLILAP